MPDEQLLSELIALREEIQGLVLKVATLEGIQESHAENQLIQLRLINQLRNEIQKVNGSTPANGEKTVARIAQINEVLTRRGPTSLKELERLLKIDNATMTRLLKKLDNRCYEVISRPNDRREKVLRFRSRNR